MKTIFLLRAKAPKKWTVVFPDGKKISFGAAGYEDYTIHKDPERLRRYLIRHQKRENWKDPHTAGFWSRWLLWSKSSLKAAIKDIEHRFNYKIKQ
jgi:hypothetical protein